MGVYLIQIQSDVIRKMKSAGGPSLEFARFASAKPSAATLIRVAFDLSNPATSKKRGCKKVLKKMQAVPEGTACKNIYRETADSVEESAVL